MTSFFQVSQKKQTKKQKKEFRIAVDKHAPIAQIHYLTLWKRCAGSYRMMTVCHTGSIHHVELFLSFALLDKSKVYIHVSISGLIQSP